MKKWIAIGLVLILALSLTSCGSKASATPEGTMAAMLDDFKAGQNVDDYFTAEGVESEYVDDEAMAGFYDLLMSIARDLDYSVDGSQEAGEEATVTVSITNKQNSVMLGDFFADYMAAYLGEAFGLMMSGEELSEEREAEILDEVTATAVEKYTGGGDLESFTAEVEVNMIKSDGEWLIDSDDKDELVMAMLGFEEEGLAAIFGDPSAQEENE